jgi:hypothetical protein
LVSQGYNLIEVKKIRFLIGFTLFNLLSISLFCQNSLLEKKLSISVRNISIKEAIEVISNKAGINFSYSDDLVSLSQKVSINAVDMSLKDILNQLFADKSIEYKMVGNQIILQTKKTSKARKFTINGFISDSRTGERLLFVNIYDQETGASAISNNYGFYSITLPEGETNLNFSYVGYNQSQKRVYLNKDTFINEFLTSDNQLAEVIITSKIPKVKNTEMGTSSLTSKEIKAVPNIFGESDLIKNIQLKAGVKGKEFANFYVRGGNNDQNLVLIDEATVYKYSHLGGFFSVFNTDAIKSAKLYKGIMPASFGGRLSSVLDVHMREGNNQKFCGSGSVGLLFSHLTLEGPIIRNKMSYIFSVRRSYFDIFFPFAANPASRKNKLFFMDLNAKINYNLSPKDKLFISAFDSNDQFAMNDAEQKTGFFYRSTTLTLRYNRVLNSKLFTNFSVLYTGFKYGSGTETKNEVTSSLNKGEWKGSLKDYTFKNDYSWYYNSRLSVKFGGSFTWHRILTGTSFQTNNENENEIPLPSINSLSSAVYVDNNQTFGKFQLNYGLRFAVYNNIGKSYMYTYKRSEFNDIYVMDTVFYKPGEIYNPTYHLEPRLAVSYNLNQSSSLKLGYSRNTQNVIQITNTTFSTPYDIWYPSNPKLKPLVSDLVSAGYFLDLNNHQYSISIESYYKKMKNIIDYKDHANLLVNPAFDNELIRGNARSYGFEIEAVKNSGKLTGTLTYTYSRTFNKIAQINNGEEYPPTFDIPHDFSLNLAYQLTKRTRLSATWVYSTGAATMLMSGYYKFMDLSVPYYVGRNSGRLPDYHRLDLALNIITKKTLIREAAGKRFRASWNFSVFNVYNRVNPYYIALRPDRLKTSVTNIDRIYLFGLFPSVTYNFEF